MSDPKILSEMRPDEENEDDINSYVRSLERKTGMRATHYFIVVVGDHPKAGAGKYHAVVHGNLFFENKPLGGGIILERLNSINESLSTWIAEQLKKIARQHGG